MKAKFLENGEKKKQHRPKSNKGSLKESLSLNTNKTMSLIDYIYEHGLKRAQAQG